MSRLPPRGAENILQSHTAHQTSNTCKHRAPGCPSPNSHTGPDSIRHSAAIGEPASHVMPCMGEMHTEQKGNKAQSSLHTPKTNKQTKNPIQRTACGSRQAAFLWHVPQKTPGSVFHGDVVFREAQARKSCHVKCILGNAAHSTALARSPRVVAKKRLRKQMARSEKKCLIGFSRVFLQAYVTALVCSQQVLIFRKQCFVPYTWGCCSEGGRAGKGHCGTCHGQALATVSAQNAGDTEVQEGHFS